MKINSEVYDLLSLPSSYSVVQQHKLTLEQHVFELHESTDIPLLFVCLFVFSINTVLDDPLAKSNDVEPQIQRADPGTWTSPDFEIWLQVLDPVLCGYWRKTVGKCFTMQTSVSLTLSLFKGQGKYISFLVPVLLSSAKLLQSCLTLCNPMDCSLPGSSVQGFSRQYYWGGWPRPPTGDLPNQGSNPGLLSLPHWEAGSLPLVSPGKHLLSSTNSNLLKCK